MIFRKVLQLACTLALLSASVFAQEFRASISGQVRDSSGGVVAGATVVATNTATNLSTTTVTAGDGNYALPQLPPGPYELTVEMTGFRKYVRRGLTLSVGDKINIGIQLEIGEINNQVTVTAALTGIESSEGALAQLLDTKGVSELPLSGRSYLMLLQLSTGVIFTQKQFGASGWSGTRQFETGIYAAPFAMHGGRPNTNAFMLDGAPQGLSGTSYIPLVDAIEEFKVAAPTSDASHGLSGGAVVNTTMRSGTNEFHGILSHFLRNRIFDSNATQSNRAAAQRPDLRKQQHQWNNFSGMIGGPIVKNRTFFTANYDGFRQRVPFPITNTMPTLEQRVGDFSKTFNSAGQLVVNYDPLTTRQVGSNFVRDAFTDNKIPTSRLSPVALNILKYVPLPNIVTDPVTNFNNYAATPNIGKYRYDSWYLKVDHLWNKSHRTFFSGTESWGSEFRSGNGIPTGNPAKTGNDPYMRYHYAATLNHVYLINPTTVLNARAGWDRWVEWSRQDSIDNFDGKALGFTGKVGSAPETRFPALSFTDYASLGTSGRTYSPWETYSAAVDLTKTQSRHMLRFGARLGQGRYHRNSTGAYYGTFSFTKAFTQRNAQQADSTSGNALAAFLLGYPASGSTVVNPQMSFQIKFIGLYLQDDIRITPRLTLNLGVRWDIQTPPTERFNRAIRGFDPNVTYTLGSAQARGGLLFADDNNRQLFSTEFGDFQPRTGVAWRIGEKMVLRAGYGLTYVSTMAYSGGYGDPLQTGWSISTPFVATTGGGAALYTPGLPGTGTLANPFPSGILQPYGSSLGPKTQVGLGLTYRDPTYVVPRVHQFNFGLGYELPWQVMVDASYVGSRTRRWPVSKNMNAIPLAERLNGVANPSYLTAAVANPFYGAPELVGTGLGTATITRSQSLLPFPQFSGLSASGVPIGYTWYDSLEVRANKRLSHDLSWTVNYTLSKDMEAISFLEPQYTTLARMLSAHDRTHHLTTYVLWGLPIGRGKALGKDWRPVVDGLLGNWQYNVTLEAMSGTPTPMPDATPTGDPRLPNNKQSFDRWFNTCTLMTTGARNNCASSDEPVAWVQLKPNELRTFNPRFSNLRDTWRPGINMSLFKNVQIREKMRLEVRAEAFNAFNTPIYAGPVTTLTAANFGSVVRDQTNFPRSMQFALRLHF